MLCSRDKTLWQADDGWNTVPIYYRGFSSLITEWPITISIIVAESNPFKYGRQVLCFYSMCQNKREASEK